MIAEHGTEMIHGMWQWEMDLGGGGMFRRMNIESGLASLNSGK